MAETQELRNINSTLKSIERVLRRILQELESIESNTR